MTAASTFDAAPPRVARVGSLEIGYIELGPANGRPVLLLHGWPDSPRTWRHLAPELARAGVRAILPFTRGFGATRFLDARTPRSGQFAALAQDAIGLADALGLDAFSVVGHDWGARAAYVLAALWPERVRSAVAISVGWGTNAAGQPLTMQQLHNYWYHWLMHTDRGGRVVREQRRELAHYMWRNWSPAWKFDEAEFDATAKAFDNPDWADVVIHSYTQRWGGAPDDPAYAALERRLDPTPVIAVPTLTIHGADDRVNPAASSEGREGLFSGRYERIALPGLGHFPQRENPAEVNRAVLDFLSN